MFEMLAEMIYSKELFSLVVFPELIDFGQMLNSSILVIRQIQKLFATVAIGIT
jgi:hypothetical protein